MTRMQLLQVRIALNNRIEMCHQFVVEAPESTYWKECLHDTQGALYSIGEIKPTDGGIAP